MSKKDKTRDVQEPWEQPIYETEEETYSRSERRQKRGNSAFLTIVLILLFLIIAIPTVAGFWTLNRNNTSPAESAQSSSSTFESSTISSTSTDTQETSSSVEESTVSSEPETPEPSEPPVDEEPVDEEPVDEQPVDEQPVETQPDEPVYETVQAGEGPMQVAARAGISLDEILRLNGLDGTEIIHPGDQLRVR